jgi:hypothetical protein
MSLQLAGLGSAARRGAVLVGLLLALGLPAAPALAAKGCCADPARFRYEPLPAQGSVDLVISASSPTFEFQSGPSAFKAFVLPAANRPYYVEVRSFVAGGPDPARARVFYPVVAVLTEDFLVSRSTDLEALRFDLPLLEGTSAPAYRVVLPIDPANAHERYIVVFTPAHLGEGRTLPPVTTPESAAEAAKIAYLGAAPYGRLRITLRPAELVPTAMVPAPPADPPPR